ncbi:MAG: hypothetical protein HOV83_06525 [Catenulispora sp.]|nr:hypothetical protein [Catenulispora sp.]
MGGVRDAGPDSVTEGEGALGPSAEFDPAAEAAHDPQPGFDPDAEQPEESFFGMQSEGMVLTGLALGPGLRRLGRVCVAVALGLGVAFWTVLVLLYGYRLIQGTQANPDMPHLPDGRPWTAYYLAGAVWAVAIGVWGLATRGSGPRLAWCFGCLVTAFFWPLGMAATVAAVAIRRPGAAMSRRLLLSGLAVLLAAGGLAWRVDAPSVNPKQTAVSSDDVLLGIWHSRSGTSVELRPDGTFTADALSAGGRQPAEPLTASGRWESESLDGHSGVRLLVDGDLSNSRWFDLYKAGPDLVLCSSDDPGDPCEVVLRRY